MIQLITEINGKINSFVWGLPMMVLILGVGIYLTVRCGFPQFCHFGHIMKNTLGKAFEKTEKKAAKLSKKTENIANTLHYLRFFVNICKRKVLNVMKHIVAEISCKARGGSCGKGSG